MAVDVHCNDNNNLAVGGASYLGGNLNSHAGLAGDVDITGGYGAAGLVNSAVATDNHVGGIGLSEGELTGHSDLLNGLGGVNGLLSEQGVAKEHAASVGIPFGAGMGSVQNGLSVSQLFCT